MCIEKRTSHARLVRVVLFLVAIVLPFGLCQNAGARGTYGDRRRSDYLGDESRSLDAHQQYSRDASSEGMEVLEENRRTFSSRGVIEEPAGTEAEVKAGPRGDERGDKHLLLSENGVKIPLRRNVNVTTSTQQQENNIGNRTRKKRRRGKEVRSPDIKDRARNVTADSRENEISGRGESPQRRGGNLASKSRPKNREARKSRAERRRRKKNDRRERSGRGRKGSQEQDDERRDDGRRSKRKRKTSGLGRLLEKLENAVGTDASERSPNVTFDRTTTAAVAAITSPSNRPQRHPTLEATRRLTRTTPRRGIYTADTVEREFSKQLEMEISKSASKDRSILDDSIFDSSPRKNPAGREPSEKSADEAAVSVVSEEFSHESFRHYDAARMLGYSRTAEDLPILDLENEVLERTLKDYNAYMTSRRNPAASFPQSPVHRAASTAAHPPRRPIMNSEESYEVPDGGSAEVTAVEVTTRAAQDDGTTGGDLSCINGTFLPAPLSRHALIKYVKSSTPGHEYLEADYECVPGFHMVSPASRLVCRSRQWVGQVPKCEIRRNPEHAGACADASCEHVCNEINGRAVCSCYEGYRLDGHKCVDIDECLLNNGHGPCQDTCRNLAGGYACSCENLRDTRLAADNHTCQRDRRPGPCSVNNAGCSHTCLSTMGRVFCLCPDGFMLEDDWKTCQDVDECSVPDLQTDLCRYGCINTPGSYRCAQPMELKDQPVLDSLSITCLPGYEQTAHGTCIDINECAVDNGGCMEVCENTDGSFFCACDGDEKALSSDGKSCVDINSIVCLPLNPVSRGYLTCSRLATSKLWRDRRKVPNRPSTRCFLKCPHGYQLHGEYELTCRSDGTWDGPQDGKCIRYSKPRLECPKDVVAELPPGRDEAFVTFDQPATDLDWFRYVRSKPSWGTRLEASLSPGVHEITFFARHPVSKKQASCVLRIIVKGGEAPKVKDCPRDIEVIGRNGTAITWTEPTFTDNVKVTQISNNESPGRRFDIGGHRIEYEASDDAGWSSKCVFTVVLRKE